MKKVKTKLPERLRKGIPLATGPRHTVWLEVTDEAMTVHMGLSLFYAMAEALEIPQILDERVKVKQRESGHPEIDCSFGYPSRLRRISILPLFFREKH